MNINPITEIYEDAKIFVNKFSNKINEYPKLKNLIIGCVKIIFFCLFFILEFSLVRVYFHPVLGNKYLSICFIIFCASITLYFLNPFNVINEFFKEKKISPHKYFSYVGTICGAILIIGNFIIFNNNYKIQNEELSVQLDLLKSQQAYYENIEKQNNRVKYYSSRDNLMSPEPSKIQSGLGEIINYLKEGNKQDSITDFYLNIPNNLSEFISLYNTKNIFIERKGNPYKYFTEIALTNLLQPDFNANYPDLINLNFLYFNDITFSNLSINSKVNLSSTKFRNLDFFNVVFTDNDIDNVEFENVKFKECQFNNCQFTEESKFTSCTFENCKIDNLDFVNAKLTSIKFKGGFDIVDNYDIDGTITKDTLDSYYIYGLNFNECKINKITFEKFLDIESLDFDSLTVISDIKFKDTNLDKYDYQNVIKNAYSLTTDTISSIDDNEEANDNTIINQNKQNEHTSNNLSFSYILVPIICFIFSSIFFIVLMKRLKMMSGKNHLLSKISILIILFFLFFYVVFYISYIYFKICF